MAKFKVGDRVIVVSTKCVDCKIGDKGTIRGLMFKGVWGDCYAAVEICPRQTGGTS